MITSRVSARTRARQRWKLMLWRCEDPTSTGYRNYGARGIKVCPQWHDFDTYYADLNRLIGPWRPGMSVDRRNNDGDYEPGNVRWATASEQQLNSRNARRPAAVTS